MLEKIKSIEHLKELTEDKPQICVTLLQCDLFTRKLVHYDKEDNTFFIDDFMTGEVGEMTEKEMVELTTIPRAIERGHFFIEEPAY